MNKICQEECWILESYIEKLMRGGNSVTLDIKPILLKVHLSPSCFSIVSIPR